MKKLFLLILLLFLSILSLVKETKAMANRSEIRGWFFQETGDVDWNLVSEIAKDYKINTFVLECTWLYGSCYPSKYVPHSGRDELALALQAAHSKGIEVHVLMLNFFIWEGYGYNEPIPEDWKAVNCNGNRVNWADPCHPKVRELTKNLTEELVSNYDIDGFMFDYIRYNDEDMSFSQYCLDKFKNDTGITATRAQVCPGGRYHNQYMEWRIKPITELVRDVKNWTTKIKPNLEFSAAVFTILYENGRAYPTYFRRAIGQDPADWVRNEYLNLVNPMVYTNDVEEYNGYTSSSIRYFVGGQEGVLPLAVWTSGLTDSNTPEQIKNIINKCREIGCDGWIIWKYGGLGSPDSSAGDLRSVFQLVNLPDTFSLGSIKAFPLSTEAIITWITDKPTASKVEFNSSPLFNWTIKTDYNYQCDCQFPYWDANYIKGSVLEDNSNVTVHSITLTGLQENKIYYFRVQSKDESGIVTTKVYNFTTGTGSYSISIVGRITDSETGLPIKAIVYCNNSGNTSDADGNYVIKLKSAGSCNLTAISFGYKTKSIPISFSGSITQDISLEPIKVNILGRLVDKTNIPVEANVSVYQETSLISTTQTDSQGNYKLSINQGIYDIQFNIQNFLPNFWIKFPSLNVLSDLQNKIKEITTYGLDKISLTVDIQTNQIIQINSERPIKILLNGTEIGNASSLSTLKSNQWYYDSVDRKLYLKVDPYPKAECIYECCKNETNYYDKPCQANYYCENRVCKLKLSCPFECCINEEKYLDKSCTLPKYCANRKCVESSGYWKFDEGSGSIAYDSSGVGNNGTIYGATWTNRCISGYCLNFDGIDDRILISHSSYLNFDGNFTLEAWVKPLGPWGGDYPGIISKYWPDGYLLGIDGGSRSWCLWLVNKEGSTTICSDSQITFNQWVHLAVVRGNDEVKMYINGTLQSSVGRISGPITPSNDLEIGSFDNLRFFNGTIDEVRIYARALSEGEIRAHVSV
jgi:hypothetical protein